LNEVPARGTGSPSPLQSHQPEHFVVERSGFRFGQPRRRVFDTVAHDVSEIIVVIKLQAVNGERGRREVAVLERWSMRQPNPPATVPAVGAQQIHDERFRRFIGGPTVGVEGG
jgi:hypothetical protein